MTLKIDFKGINGLYQRSKTKIILQNCYKSTIWAHFVFKSRPVNRLWRVIMY